MGTNYYGIKIPTTADKEEMIRLIHEEEWGDLLDKVPVEIHLGKSSGGWQFIFNHHDFKFYDKSRKSIEEFIHGMEIWDEYNKDISEEEFWKMVEDKKNGTADTKYGTIEDGLNFSQSTDFS
jgi:hypothetical protein